MPRQTPRLALTRFYVADLARRGHELAKGEFEPPASPKAWAEEWRRLKNGLHLQGDAALLSAVSLVDDTPDSDGNVWSSEWALDELRDDPARMTRAEKNIVARAASGLDRIVNSDCHFDSDALPDEQIIRLLKGALAVATDRAVRFDDLMKLRPGVSTGECTRFGATLLDRALAQALHSDSMHIYPSRCTLWLEEAQQRPVSPSSSNGPPSTASSRLLRISDLGELTEIGRGGFGTVYSYLDPELRIEFALKVFDPSSFNGPDARPRFLREAGLLFLLRHENIIRIFDAGTLDDGRPYIRMERFGGESLEKKKSELTPAAIPRIIGQLADALSHAHTKGIVHRDLKPSNVLVGMEAHDIRLIDFGLGILVEEAVGRARLTTSTQNLAGAFSAPELLENPKATNASLDTYSLGAVWYWLLSGRQPYGTGIDAAIARLSIDDQVKSLMGRCLSHDSDNRPSLAELCRSLSPALPWGSFSTIRERLVGTWTHSWTRPGSPESHEIATIHADGTYDVNGTPSFRLGEVELDAREMTIALHKVALSTHPVPSMRNFTQREVLNIASANSLVGHVKDQPLFKVSYSRKY